MAFVTSHDIVMICWLTLLVFTLLLRGVLHVNILVSPMLIVFFSIVYYLSSITKMIWQSMTVGMY